MTLIATKEEFKVSRVAAFVQTIRSNISALLWKRQFAWWYPASIGRPDVHEELLAVAKHTFNHLWVSNITLALSHGRELSAENVTGIDAPIVLIVWRKGKQALIMSCYISGSYLVIKQMQGVRWTKTPPELD